MPSGKYNFFDEISAKVIAPIMFFIGGLLGYVTVLTVVASLAQNPAFIVLGCAVFIGSFNAFRVGLRLTGVIKG